MIDDTSFGANPWRVLRVAWLRGRAHVVMVRAAGAFDYASVGTEDPPWWTPGAGETVAAARSSVSRVVPFPPWDMDPDGIHRHDWLKP